MRFLMNKHFPFTYNSCLRVISDGASKGLQHKNMHASNIRLLCMRHNKMMKINQWFNLI